MRISDWSSDVCSSDLNQCISDTFRGRRRPFWHIVFVDNHGPHAFDEIRAADDMAGNAIFHPHIVREIRHPSALRQLAERSEEHTSELQSLMRISYAVFCLKKKKKHSNIPIHHIHITAIRNNILTQQE